MEAREVDLEMVALAGAGQPRRRRPPTKPVSDVHGAAPRRCGASRESSGRLSTALRSRTLPCIVARQSHARWHMGQSPAWWPRYRETRERLHVKARTSSAPCCMRVRTAAHCCEATAMSKGVVPMWSALATLSAAP